MRVVLNCESCLKSPKIPQYLFFLLVLKNSKDFVEQTQTYTHSLKIAHMTVPVSFGGFKHVVNNSLVSVQTPSHVDFRPLFSYLAPLPSERQPLLLPTQGLAVNHPRKPTSRFLLLLGEKLNSLPWPTGPACSGPQLSPFFPMFQAHWLSLDSLNN